MGVATIVAAVALTVAVVSGAIADGKAHKAKRKARNAKQEAKFQMDRAISNRQDIINPYAGITDLSGLATDLSSQITNPFNNLQVSTAAAEMQAEESDIALANTLDTLEMTGASAGGATALAMAALKSKKDVAATIQEQEARNAELRAHGERAAQDAKVRATERYQDVAIEQGARAEDAEAQGQIFEWQAQENRTNNDIARYQQMYTGFAAQQNNAEMAQVGAWTQVAASAGQIGSAAAGGIGGGGGAAGGGATGMFSAGTSTSGIGGQFKQYGASCFIEDSKVHMNDGILKSIQDIKIGDEVKSLNGKVKVKNVLIHNINDIERIYNNGSCYTTDKHPLYINNRWTNAKELNWNSESQFVDKLYNLETESTFIVNNVVASGLVEKLSKESIKV